MKIKQILTIVLVTFLSVLISCKGAGRKGDEFVFPESDSIPINEAIELSQEAIDAIVQNISSPVEMAALLKALDVPFMPGHLASIRDADRLSTNFSKALKLGVYGADLGYLNIYENTGSAIEYLSTINKFADELLVGQFFDFEMLKRLATNKSNIDSLLYLSVNSYNQIDDYLRNNDRGHLSALMITGVWIEAQYLACQVAKDYDHEELRNRVGEQKIIINDLLLLLIPYKDSSDDFSKLYEDFEMLKDVYRGVDITFTMGELTTEEIDGRLVVIQKDESHIEMTDEQLVEIIDASIQIRHNIISQ
jgi:hypothetical protein